MCRALDARGGGHSMPASGSKPLAWFKEDNIRQSYDLDDLRLLQASLAKKQWVPLLCQPCGTIVDGHRRYRAAMLEGKPETLDVVIVETTDPAQIRQTQLTLGLSNVALTPIEVYGGLAELRKHFPEAKACELA